MRIPEEGLTKNIIEKINIGCYIISLPVTVATPITGLAGGVYVGYCNAKGIHMDHEFALKYGPTIMGSIAGISWDVQSSEITNRSIDVPTDALFTGLIIFTGAGAAVGGATTLAGYLMGYLIGSGGF